MSYSRFTVHDTGRSLPRAIISDSMTLHPPIADDVSLVAELMGVPADAERPAEVLRTWQSHWETHGYGSWIIQDDCGRNCGFVGLRTHQDFIRVTLRMAERASSGDLAARALRLIVSYAVEWLPDLPLRLRLAPEDLTTRRVAESAGMVHVPELDHGSGEDQWQVFELPYVRVADRVPTRAREAMLDMWVRVNDAGGAVGFLPGTDRGEVELVLDGYVAWMGRGDTVCVSLNSPLGDLLGFGFVVGSTGALMGHTANIERIMTDPDLRGTNHGALLVAGLHRAARERGVEIVTLDYRGGTGLGEFYAKYGYSEVGRVPGAVRVAPGDDRDGVIMSRSL